ncbi:MAG: hypothetical protein GY835_23810 [bacterium]|nr:hypothetical protein [bacterium]
MNQAIQKAQANAAQAMESAAAERLSEGRALTQTQTQYTTAIAVQNPRDKKDVLERALEEAELLAEQFYYSWTTKNRDGSRGVVEGMGIEGAMALAREYGNCVTDVISDETKTHWHFRATFVDLETGFTCAREFKQRKKGQARGGLPGARMEEGDFAIGQSKAVRGAIDKGLPAWLKKKCLARAKQAAAADMGSGDKISARQKVQGAFARHGVTIEQIEARFGAFDTLAAEDMGTLRGILSSLNEGLTTAGAEFGQEPPMVDPETGEVREPGQEG